MNRVLKLKSIKDIRTMTDPYRMKIIRTFHFFDRPVTVKDLATELDEPHGKVYYHVKKMIDFGAVKLVKTEKINGIVAKYYELTFDSLDVSNCEDDDEDTQRSSYKKLVNQFFNEYRDMFKTTIDKIEKNDDVRNRSVLVGTELHFSAESFEEFNEELDKLIKKYIDKKEGDFFRKQMIYSYFTAPKDLDDV